MESDAVFPAGAVNSAFGARRIPTEADYVIIHFAARPELYRRQQVRKQFAVRAEPGRVHCFSAARLPERRPHHPPEPAVCPAGFGGSLLVSATIHQLLTKHGPNGTAQFLCVRRQYPYGQRAAGRADGLLFDRSAESRLLVDGSQQCRGESGYRSGETGHLGRHDSHLADGQRFHCHHTRLHDAAGSGSGHQYTGGRQGPGDPGERGIERFAGLPPRVARRQSGFRRD